MEAIASTGRLPTVPEMEGLLTELWDTREELNTVREELRQSQAHSKVQEAELQRVISLLQKQTTAKGGKAKGRQGDGHNKGPPSYPLSSAAPSSSGPAGPRGRRVRPATAGDSSAFGSASRRNDRSPRRPDTRSRSQSPRAEGREEGKAAPGLVAKLREQVSVLRSVLAQRDEEVRRLQDSVKATRVQELEQQAAVFLSEIGRLKDTVRDLQDSLSKETTAANGFQAELMDVKKAHQSMAATAAAQELARVEAEATVAALLKRRPEIGMRVYVLPSAPSSPSHRPGAGPRQGTVTATLPDTGTARIKFDEGYEENVAFERVEVMEADNTSEDPLTTIQGVDHLRAAQLMQRRCDALVVENAHLRMQLGQVLYGRGDDGASSEGTSSRASSRSPEEFEGEEEA